MVGTEARVCVSEAGEGSAADSALIQAGLAGDRSALDLLLGQHKRSLVAFCFGILGHAEDAEDAAQETFLRALRALPGFRGDAAFRTWLYRIAVNTCLRWKASRRTTEPWDEEGAQTAGETASPERLAVGHLWLMQALYSLPTHRRVVLLLKEWEGCSVAEIAGAMSWNERRVKNELYKARRALAEWRKREAVEGEEL
jgi:RNA polymerase sigma-70 factor (ECF subfamily)